MRPEVKSTAAISPITLMRRRIGGAFGRDQRGAAAIEFGLLALPFFAIIGAIMETAFFFLASEILDSSVDSSVRLLRTGQAQSQGLTADQFRDTICDGLYGLFPDCKGVDSKLQVDVKTITNFASTSFALPLDDTFEWSSDFEDTKVYEPGNGSDIISVHVYYKWPTMLDFFGFNLSNAGQGYRLMASVRVFKNEPFGGSSSGSSS